MPTKPLYENDDEENNNVGNIQHLLQDKSLEGLRIYNFEDSGSKPL